MTRHERARRDAARKIRRAAPCPWMVRYRRHKTSILSAEDLKEIRWGMCNMWARVDAANLYFTGGRSLSGYDEKSP